MGPGAAEAQVPGGPGRAGRQSSEPCNRGMDVRTDVGRRAKLSPRRDVHRTGTEGGGPTGDRTWRLLLRHGWGRGPGVQGRSPHPSAARLLHCSRSRAADRCRCRRGGSLAVSEGGMCRRRSAAGPWVMKAPAVGRRGPRGRTLDDDRGGVRLQGRRGAEAGLHETDLGDLQVSRLRHPACAQTGNE